MAQAKRNSRRAETGASSQTDARDTDLILDVPELSAENLEVEIEDLQVPGVLRAGKVRVGTNSLDARLYLDADLENLRLIVRDLTGTANLGMKLFFAPAYGFTLCADPTYKNLETWRRVVEARAGTRLPGSGRRRIEDR